MRGVAAARAVLACSADPITEIMQTHNSKITTAQYLAAGGAN